MVSEVCQEARNSTQIEFGRGDTSLTSLSIHKFEESDFSGWQWLLDPESLVSENYYGKTNLFGQYDSEFYYVKINLHGKMFGFTNPLA